MGNCCTGRKSAILSADMGPDMQEVAMDIANRAITLPKNKKMDSLKSKEDKFTRMSEFIQTELDRKYSPGWQCIVGNKLRVTPKEIPGDPKGGPDTFIVRGHLW